MIEPEEPQSPSKAYRWYHKLAGLMAVIFCFELGIFLLIFPWVSDWHLNYFATVPFWRSEFWTSPYVRGAVSGIGLLDIYISLVEVFRLRRFSGE